jgi:hypothetical protein
VAVQTWLRSGNPKNTLELLERHRCRPIHKGIRKLPEPWLALRQEKAFEGAPKDALVALAPP